MKRLLFLFLLMVGVGFLIFKTSIIGVEAKEDKKVDICHCERPDSSSPFKCQNLNIAESAADKHLEEHDADTKGKCKRDVCSNIEDIQQSVPENYYQVEGACYPKTPSCLDKKASNYDSDFDEDREYKDNETCKYPTHRWCKEVCLDEEETFDKKKDKCENKGYEAIAVKDTDKDPKGKPWVTGMDAFCNFTPAGQCPTACGLSASTVPDGKGGQIACNATAACTTTTTTENRPHAEAPSNFKACISPTKSPINPLVWRKADQAIVQWQPQAGFDKANVYYKLVGSAGWQHSVPDTENDGYVVINGLGKRDWTFGVQEACGPIATIIDGATNGWHLFVPNR